MSKPVYSRQLVLQESFQGGPLNFYSVPVGFVTVIKFISLTYGINVTPGWMAVLESTTGAKLFAAGAGLTEVPTHDFVTAAEFGTWTLEYPQGISLATGGSPVAWFGDFAVSGYELSLP